MPSKYIAAKPRKTVCLAKHRAEQTQPVYWKILRFKFEVGPWKFSEKVEIFIGTDIIIKRPAGEREIQRDR